MRNIAICTIIGFILGCFFSCKDISNAIYSHKEDRVRKLIEKYFRIKYPPNLETVEYEVTPFIDSVYHDKKYYKKNDIFFIKHTIRNSEKYDSILTTHHSADIFMDVFKESQKLNKYLYFKVTNGVFIEPIDSISYSNNLNYLRRGGEEMLNKIRDLSDE